MSNNIKFVRGSLKFNKRNATLKIPLKLAKELYEKAGGDCDTFLSIQNGILTVSPKIPDLVIPMVHLKEEYWMPQKD